jgi:hypothetical protein
MTATVATLAGARRLYVVAGLAAFLAMLANVVDIVLGFGGEMVTYGARPAAEWFDVFQRSSFEGLYALGVLNIVYMLGMLPVYVGILPYIREFYGRNNMIVMPSFGVLLLTEFIRGLVHA